MSDWSICNHRMAHLLGSKTCIDSLRVDIDDLQNVIYDIIGKTGTIKCHSWKFPDKLATDVDIKQLLERYQYGKNELDNQVSHIILFEIIIDRLLLVIHGSWRFLHEIQTKLLSNTIDSSSTINQQTCLSVGLVVKKYWNKLMDIFTILQQHESNRKRSNHSITLAQSKSTITTEKHCQTIETSFGPCSSCTKLQQCLRDYGDSVINLCHTYNLPSSLAHHRCSTTIIPEWLSSDDINHWFDSQSKDFDGLSKHLEYLNNTLIKTKTDLDSNEKRSKQQNETNHRLQRIVNENTISTKVSQELHENKISEMKKEYDEEKSNLNEQIKILITQKIKIEQQLKELNDECTSKGEQIEKLELSKTELKILTEDQIKSDNLIKILEQDRIRLQTELDVIKRDLEERNRESQKERIRIENMIRQEENSQSKQKALSKSHEELSQECEALKKQVTELEFERDELQKSLQISEKQNKSSLETNDHVLQEVASLKTIIEQLHQQMKEREEMLVKLPDSNGPNQTISASDNLVHNMENQMRINELHIDSLRKQNDSLKSSLENVLLINNSTNLSKTTIEDLRNQSQQEQSYRRYSHGNEIVTPKPRQTPLWLLNNEIIEQQAFTETRPVATTNYIPRSNENDRWIKSDSDVHIELLPQQYNHTRTTPSMRIQSTELVLTAESRPPIPARSSWTVNNGRTSTIPPPSDHNMAIGRGRSTISNRPSTIGHPRRDTSLPKSSRNISSAKTNHLALNITHRCTNCNQSFDDKRNYDMHKLYCRT